MFYLDLFKSLEKHQVQYLLVGGVAMNLHGVPRNTMDIDLVLALDEKNLDRFLLVAADLGLKPAYPIPISDLKSPIQRKTWVEDRNMIVFSMNVADIKGPTVDILLDHVLDWEKAKSRAVRREMDSIPINLASVEDMIQLKEHAGREQDLSDLIHLKKMVSDV
jgi:hypothetical protein